MFGKSIALRISSLLALSTMVLAAGCSGNQTTVTATPVIVENLPQITSVELDHTEVARYASLEMSVSLEAQYTNPYDARQVSLDGVFTGPDGAQWKVPGFWDGETSWRMRFTPSQEGGWNYKLSVTDGDGTSQPAEGSFMVIPSDLHGWLQAGNRVDPAYSGHYLVYQDGTPFYGLGHCDALNILVDGYDTQTGVGLFNNMKAAGENYVVWWPTYSNSIIGSSYDDYTLSNMKIIDLVVQDAQAKGIFLIFTIWDHPNLRAEGHPWGGGRWAANGFSKLSDISAFFTDAEPWAWQENFYRYIIARWGYSPAIGMWQTVTEINGTNAYDQTDPWHEKVNAYFVDHDPYRHPTTASRSGGVNDVAWPEGHAVMDAPQVHIYDELGTDAVGSAAVLANWTSVMWNEQDKPNWVGEFGVPGDTYYPELFHNSIWAALGAGAAMTPAEWNGGNWGSMTPAMLADMGRLGQFVADIPLAKLNPSALQISSSDAQVRGWGVAGADGGLFWVQDFSLEGSSIEVIRNAGAARTGTQRTGVQLEIQGMAAGTYAITPYDTWQGTYLQAFEVTCQEGQACSVALPAFKADMAFKVERK
jgi:hypothetical protein